MKRGANPTKITKDWFTRQNATELAAKIAAFWAARGEQVSTWIEEIERPNKSPKNEQWFAVRSDLIRGIPQPKLAKAA